ncbi:hypothetical protein K1719_036373 [Acacia pycnantha]|nr:hypothetical protein K1719_036373 [Acacia pycnantha]
MPSSSTSTSAWTYDVFLSFRGQDTRFSFTSDLYNALRNERIHAFMDDLAIQKGEDISASLLHAIQISRIALIVFSKDYASSGWCLDELVQIMKCQETQTQVVVPIFYYVDPSDVRHQRGSYGEAMERHEQSLGRGSDRVLRWRQALTAAANLAGFNRTSFEYDYQLIEKIVADILRKIDAGQLIIADHPVGIESRVLELTNEWSKKRSEKVLIIGLCGMGGLGKTTIAKAIYNKIGRQYKARSFLANIRENSKHANGQVNLQVQLIYDITKTKVFKTPNIDRGKKIIQERFPNIQALVVLDDVDSVDQLSTLYGSHEWFCPGSVIIITTRNLRPLNVLSADHKYIVKELNGIESLELFCWHAFEQAAPFENFEELSKSVVDYCGGLPLALEILGSFLRNRTILEWKVALSKLQRIPNKDIHATLRISYDGLNDYTEKEIFLDICCFFINKDKNYVTQILDGCQLHATWGLQILIERSLVKIGTNNKLEMHDLLQEMGEEIIRESSPKDPEKRSRLWFHEDVLEVLTEHTGTKAIEGISLKMETTPNRCLVDSKAFKKMRKLRLLRLDFVNVEGDFKHLSRELSWLCWHGFPLKYAPNNFYQKNLVAIDFKCSNLREVWKEPQLLKMLKTLNLSHSSYLKETPNFAYLPNLERLVMKDCRSLIVIHKSIGNLNFFFHLNVKDCKSLRDLPRSIYKLKSLKTLILSGCSSIDRLEDDFEQMESLTMLKADGTAITTVPKSLTRLEKLKHGHVSFPGHEGRSQEAFHSLVLSWMSPTNIPHSRIKEFVQSISSIAIAVAGRNSGFCGLSPFLSDLVKLRGMWEECRSQFRFNGIMARLLDALYETNFMELESAQDIPQISYMDASELFEAHNQLHIARPTNSFNFLLLQLGVCDKVDLLKEEISQGWNNGGWDDSYLPGDQCPDWFIYKGDGRSVIFTVPQVIGCHLKAMLLNVMYSSCMNNIAPQSVIHVLIINHTKPTVNHLKGDKVTFLEDAEWQSFISSVQPGDLVELVLSIGPQLLVKKIAAYVIYDGSKRRRLLK